MKLTPKELQELTEAIFIKFPLGNDEFELLLDLNGHPLHNLDDAKKVAKGRFGDTMWQISTFEQALINNGQIDNF